MPERSNIESEIRERAQRDPEYRARLLADARAALAADHELDIPESLAIRVIEEGADEVVLVVPAARSAVQDLADTELEGAAGGWGTGSTCVATCAGQAGC